MGFWDVLSKTVSLVFIAVFMVIIIVGLIAFYATRSALRKVDRMVDTVRTATNRGLDEVQILFKSASGTFQGVQHTVGDLVSIVKNGAQSGIYEVQKNFDLVKQEVDKITHLVQDGTFKGTQMFTDFQKDIHQIMSTINNHPIKIQARDILGDPVVLDFKLQGLDKCMLTAEALANSTIAGRTVTFNPFTVAGQALTFTHGVTTVNTLIGEELKVVLDTIHNQVEVSWSTLF